MKDAESGRDGLTMAARNPALTSGLRSPVVRS